MTDQAPQLSIVVPTYREVDNLKLLTQRIFKVIRSADISAELIFVDDNSQDGSSELVDTLKAEYPVRMILRTTERGLSTAVLCGFEQSRGQVLLVMDADLSHPADRIPELFHPIASRQADFVIGSRYAAGGETKDWPFLRKMNSWIATMLARPLTTSSDPMAGFFCLQRKTWQQADQLNPLGYKIGLELMIKGRCQKVQEVPIVFADRHAGESKLTLRQQLLYLLHLKRLYFYKYPIVARLVLYGAPLILLVSLLWMLLNPVFQM